MNVSVVVPVFDEVENLPRLLSEVPAALDENELVDAWELICVDDGSPDGSGAWLDRAAQEPTAARQPEAPARDPGGAGHGVAHPRRLPLTVIHLPENRGKSAALATGFARARYEVVGTLDADLQTRPRDFHPLLEAIAQGADGAVGYRVRRRDGPVRRASSWIAGAVRHAVIHDGFRDITCPLQLYRAASLRAVEPFRAFHRYLPHLVTAAGGTVVECPVPHYPRIAGQAKYGVLNRLGIGVRSLLYVRRLGRGDRRSSPQSP